LGIELHNAALHYPGGVEFPKITLVGVGLLGGSIGLAVKQRGLAECVAGLVRREESIAECTKVGVVDMATLDSAEAVGDATLVILCTQVGQMGELAEQLKPHLADGAIVTDVGSVKADVVATVESVLPRFVGSHPLAGSEKTGVANARADLLEDALCAVTPTERTDGAAVESVEKFWQSLGARTARLSPEAHDLVVARTSHLPHMLATALVRCVLGGAENGEADFCATGFRDSTRLADGAAPMWRDIAMANPKAIVAALDDLQEELDGLRTALEVEDAEALEQFFDEGRRLRSDWLKGRE
jgi:prephenate dehydrogenase